MKAPRLLFAIGNPSRGDDALGPAFLERARVLLSEEIARGEVELLTDFQLQVEHALDLADRTSVLFVDASVRATPPFELSPIRPSEERTAFTHAMSPDAVLAAVRTIHEGPLPKAWMLAIRGESFELGEPLSHAATSNLERALAFLVDFKP